MHHRIATHLLLAVAAAGLTACGGMSDRAREIAGVYYIPEVSEDTPLLELDTDGSCLVRAVKPGVLTYEVPGKWDVLRDSLIIHTDASKLKFMGDSTLIGHVAKVIAKRVSGFNGISLTLAKGGIEYVYHRRNE